MNISRCILIALAGAYLPANSQDTENKTLAHWRFEKAQLQAGDTLGNTGKIGTAEKTGTVSGTLIYDESGNGNVLEFSGAAPASISFSTNVPKANTANLGSLSLNRSEYTVSFQRPLAYYDLSKSWTIEASLLHRLPGTEQVFICKEGKKGQSAGDVSIGFDPMAQKYFAEVMCADGEARRVATHETVRASTWYDIRAWADYDVINAKTTLQIAVRESGEGKFGKQERIIFDGPALNRGAGKWIIGRGFPGGYPNSQAVLDGGIDEVRIMGKGVPRKAGQNPLFTDVYTADPAALVVGKTVYMYVGHDAAPAGGWFTMPEWLCYSSTDMKNWTAHGPVLAAKDFVSANSNSAWAAQVVEKSGKYYFYVTLDRKEGHFITVAVGDSPTGPFKEALPGKPLVTDAMTTDSHRPNSDIDPTVFIDDDGTPWLAWGNGDCYMVKLKKNMVEIDGPITKVPFRNYSEGPWLFKRNGLYYNIYAADAPGVQPEQIAYATAKKITGPWTYRGLLTGPAKHGFTIHPSVIEFNSQWYFIYHDGSYSLNREPGGDTRRAVCAEYLYFNPDGTIKPIMLTSEGISVPPKFPAQ